MRGVRLENNDQDLEDFDLDYIMKKQYSLPLKAGVNIWTDLDLFNANPEKQPEHERTNVVEHARKYSKFNFEEALNSNG